jgi:pimeloyl-ACP methyl ester carboxylesterase
MNPTQAPVEMLRHGRIDLRHGRIDLALHTLQASDAGSGAPLLILHSLGGATPETVPDYVAGIWNGPVFGLDFTGHGQSTCPVGGGYSAEVLMGDADTALRHIGPSVILGLGLGSYVGLLVAGAAPERVQAVIVAGGTGLAGGGVRPGSESIVRPVAAVTGATPDPYALIELSNDVRPPNYIASFVRQFVSAAPVEHPVSVCTAARPPWLSAVVEEFGVVTCTIGEALESYMT